MDALVSGAQFVKRVPETERQGREHGKAAAEVVSSIVEMTVRRHHAETLLTVGQISASLLGLLHSPLWRGPREQPPVVGGVVVVVVVVVGQGADQVLC